MPRRTLILAAVLLVPSFAEADVTSRYLSLALQGDLATAPEMFAGLDPEGASARDLRMQERFEHRFETGEQLPLPEDPFAAEVVRVYRAYWRQALLGGAENWSAADSSLKEQLLTALADAGRRDVPDGDLFETIGSALEDAGYYHLSGKTLPHYELMLWARQDTSRFDVTLTDEQRNVTVVFVRDFLVKGWADFATFGHASTGGWAGENALFCLGDDYDLDSERFRVSYLQHETRHFADYDRFPELEQIDLEYRAKLTELIYARETTFALLEQFTRSASPNPDAPHSFANHAVTRDLAREVDMDTRSAAADPWWQAAGADAIRTAAARLLLRSTQALEAAGAATVTGIVRSLH